MGSGFRQEITSHIFCPGLTFCRGFLLDIILQISVHSFFLGDLTYCFKSISLCHENHLNSYSNWKQLKHMNEYMCFPKNIGKHLSHNESHKIIIKVLWDT